MNIIRRIKKKISRIYFLIQARNNVTKTHLTFRKFGTNYGGWYIPAEIIDKGSTCICVGAGEDISFDLELARVLSCRILIVDPTPRAKKHFDELLYCSDVSSAKPANNNITTSYDMEGIDLTKLKFVDKGIWRENERVKFYAPKNPDHVSHSILNCQNTLEYFEADCVTPATLVRDFGLQGIEILKLDIETAEYDVIEQMMRENIRPKILCVEYDEGYNPLDKKWRTRIRDSVRALKDYGYALCYVDAFNFTFIDDSRIPSL